MSSTSMNQSFVALVALNVALTNEGPYTKRTKVNCVFGHPANRSGNIIPHPYGKVVGIATLSAIAIAFPVRHDS
jgi:hypothetical protein